MPAVNLWKMTVYGKTIRNELLNLVQSFYPRLDVEEALEQYREAVRKNSTDRSTLSRKLRIIYSARDLKFSEDSRAQQESLSLFPKNAEEIVGELIDKLHKMYVHFPRGEDFLARVVEKYASATDRENFRGDDSLRLRLLKIFVANGKNPLGKSADTLTEADFAAIFPVAIWRQWLTNRLTSTNSKEWPLLSATLNFNVTTITELPTLERQFVEYLAKFRLVVDNETGSRRDEIFARDKAELVLDKGNVFNVIGRFGNYFFLSLQEFVSFLSALAKKHQDNEQSELTADEKHRLIQNFRLPLEPLASSSLTILETILGNHDNDLNWSENRKRFFFIYEERLAKIDPIFHKTLKADWLKRRHREKLLNHMMTSGKLIGSSCGLDMEVWSAFFNEQLANNKPTMPLCTELTQLINIPDDKVVEKHKEIVAYLKQFSREGSEPTVGHLFHKAWQRHLKSAGNNEIRAFLREIDDLANLRFDRELKTKEILYRLALLLDLSTCNDPTSVLEEIFDDVYSDNFFSSSEDDFVVNSAALSEGIRWRSPFEATYVYCLNRRDLCAAKRLNVADQVLQFLEQARNNIPQGAAAVLANNNDTKTFENLFITTLQQLPLTAFENSLLNYFDISLTREDAAAQRSAVNVYIDIVAKIRNVINRGANVRDVLDRASSSVADLIDMTRAKDNNDAGFMRLLSRLQRTFDVIGRGLMTRNPQNGVNRTDLIVLFLVYFTAERLPSFVDMPLFDRNLVYLNFVDELNGYLDRANFKEFSVKSAVDLCCLAILCNEVLNR